MTAPAQALIAALEGAAPGGVRPAAAGDAVAGVASQVVAEPASEHELAGVLAHADGAGLKVLVRGGGTQLGLGFPPAGGGILLSTARLNRLVEHTPHDMTATVQAGMTLAALQAALAPAGQWLALDPPQDAGATIGGIIATNASGARRLRYGGVRDQLIGVRVALADGTIARGGGKVVKNVAGYDLPKLYTGALGTLGVIVAATFRLYPLPAASRTVVFASADLPALCAFVGQLNASPLEPTVLDIIGSTAGGETSTLAARFECLPAAADDQAERLLALAGTLAEAPVILRDDGEAAFWQRINVVHLPIDSDEHALTLKASLLPSDLASWLARLRASARERGLEAHWRAHAGHGLVFARLSGDQNVLLAAVAPLRQAAAERQGSLIVLDAPPALTAAGLDPWGASPALALMRRLKEQFDPHATLNPGRFIGRI